MHNFFKTVIVVTRKCDGMETVTIPLWQIALFGLVMFSIGAGFLVAGRLR